jgi:hypothetical protein
MFFFSDVFPRQQTVRQRHFTKIHTFAVEKKQHYYQNASRCWKSNGVCKEKRHLVKEHSYSICLKTKLRPRTNVSFINLFLPQFPSTGYDIWKISMYIKTYPYDHASSDIELLPFTVYGPIRFPSCPRQ